MIKFRGIPLEDVSDIDEVNFDGTFVYGNYVKYGDSVLIVGDMLEASEDGLWPSWWVTVDSKTVEQFTGLTDVNGKDIYEGDIIKSNYKYAQPKISQIIMEDGNSYIAGEDLATGNEMLVSDHVDEIEVIGNVHENPELLEV
ncbi:YopX family protein [Lactiplantibacillus argentoratensis]|uniref:YopX family protein n=1 Tax=Lactiplantibacillus argentoratensis TaxID=271881 RepID=UPI0025505EFF|nr:YopX family protein [Lactiplantibacillus argentoratensis]MDK9681629.1 YopX family protein [Lactiplantibacillus argentoratensis]